MKGHDDIRIGTLAPADKGAEYLRQILPHGFESFQLTFWKHIGGVDIKKLAREVRELLNETGNKAVISSLGIFAAVFFVGGYLLLRRRSNLSPVQILLLIALVAIFGGRFLEMMVGVARVSDLTILWALLGVFAALPGITSSPQVATEQTSSTRTTGRRNQSRRRSSNPGYTYHWNLLWRLAIVAWIVGAIGIVSGKTSYGRFLIGVYYKKSYQQKNQEREQ